MPASDKSPKQTSQDAENTRETIRRAADAARNTVSETALTAQVATDEAANVAKHTTKETARAAADVTRQAADAGRTALNQAARTARTVTEEAANAGQTAAHAGADIARGSAETVRQVAQSSVDMATQAAQRSVSQFAQAFGLSGERIQETAHQSTRSMQTMAECGTILARGFQDISREWVSFAQARVRKNVEGLGALARCRTPQDFVALQRDFVRDNLEGALNSSRRISEISAEVAGEAVRKIADQAEENSRQVHRAA